MFDRYRGAKEILVFAFAVLLAALVLFSWSYNDTIKQQVEQEAYDGATDGGLSNLIAEKNELEQKIADCQYMIDYGSIGPVVVLFAEPDLRLTDTGIETINRMNVPAVIAVSNRYFPGEKGCLSVDQVNQCLEDGWELALNCTADTDVSALKKRVEEAGLGGAACVYYSDGTDSAGGSDGESKPEGISRVIRYGANKGGFMTYGIAGGDFEITRKSTQEDGDCMVMVIGYHDDRCKTEDISSWLTSLSHNSTEEHYEIMNLTEAAVKVSENHEFKKENNKKLEAEIEKYQRQLDKVEKKIHEKNQEYEE